MGCNCGGSTPPNQQQQTKTLVAPRSTTRHEPRPRRTGGPGEPGYTWNGPPKRTG